MLAAPRISSIDKKSVHNICSGQVIVTLATAVKELVENSIDAEADSINIVFREHGLQGIEVSDNGKGIEKENFVGLTLKHFTSKIKEFEDISDVSTYGFRGEALSSLCALGDLTVLTSTGSVGTHLTYDRQGNIKKSCVQARPKGTTIVIEKLFSTLPVRHREFSKNIKKEYHKAIDSLQAYAMIALNTRIHCLNIIKKRKQVIFSTQGKSSVKENVIDILGASIFNNLVSIEFSTSIFEVYGFISKPLPKHGRGSADRQYYFVNGRPCDHDKLNKVVNQVFKSFEKFQYPICVLVIDVAKGKLDVNVCPDKRKLFIDNENDLIESLSKHLESEFQKYTGVYKEQNKAHVFNIIAESCETNDAKSLQIKGESENVYSKSDSDVSFSTQTIMPVHKNSNFDQFKSDNCKNEGFVKEKYDLYKSRKLRKLSSPLQDKNIIQSSETFLSDNKEAKFHINFIQSPKKMGICFEHNIKEANNEKITIFDTLKYPVEKFDEPLVTHAVKHLPLHCSLKLIKDQSNIYRCIQASTHSDNMHFKHQIVSSVDAENELEQQIEKDMFRKMNIIGQFNLGFIIVKLASNLFIIDQHASDEKYRYEFLKKVSKIETQKLLHPKSLNLNGAQEELLLSYEHVFNQNGFEFLCDEQKMPGHRVSLIALPRSESQIFDESDVEELLWLLSEDTSVNIENLRPSKVHRMFASRACRSAIMIGTALGSADMQKILDHMASMDHPWSCPHGRPTMRHLVDLSRTY